VVHVGGEVADPGLYTLPSGSRVADAVEEAGGALPDADLDLLNLARPLVDGEQVLVGVPVPAGTGGPGTGPQGTGGLVDINRADRALLETLPGVGTVIADNIVTYREEHGPFRSVGDLINVDRIGEKVLANLEPHVTVG
jgi:competence protein ComEA